MVEEGMVEEGMVEEGIFEEGLFEEGIFQYRMVEEGRLVVARRRRVFLITYRRDVNTLFIWCNMQESFSLNEFPITKHCSSPLPFRTLSKSHPSVRREACLRFK